MFVAFLLCGAREERWRQEEGKARREIGDAPFFFQQAALSLSVSLLSLAREKKTKKSSTATATTATSRKKNEKSYTLPSRSQLSLSLSPSPSPFHASPTAPPGFRASINCA